MVGRCFSSSNKSCLKKRLIIFCNIKFGVYVKFIQTDMKQKSNI